MSPGDNESKTQITRILSISIKLKRTSCREKKAEETSVHSQIFEDCGLYQKCDDEGPTRVCSSLSRTVQKFHPTVPERRASHLNSEIKRLVVTLCGRIFTSDFMTKIENFSPEMLNLAGKFAEKPIVSENVERAFREKATLKYKTIFYVNVRKHFITGIRHISSKCPLEKDGFLEALRFLSPST